MIAITRADEPAKLKISKAKDAWCSIPDVRTTLHDMQSGKCCYCESKIHSSGPRQQIEHYWPKGTYDDKRNLWENLLLACDLCNHTKGGAFPLDDLGQPLVIDPTSGDVNPESELTFFTQFNNVDEYRLLGQAVRVPGSTRGERTIEVVGLSKKHHRKERRRHFEQVLFPWLKRYVKARDDNDAAEIDSLLRELGRHTDSPAEYAGFARAFARDYSLPLSAP